MAGRVIEVQSYSGYRGEEMPRSFALGRQITVQTVKAMWIQESQGLREQRRCFEITGNDGLPYTICHDPEADRWYLIET